jgi:SAM-dependent methyltransferase
LDALKRLELTDIAKLFGGTEQEIQQSCHSILQDFDNRYRVTQGAERDELILQVLKKTHAVDLPVAGEQRLDDWNRGWGENLAEFVESGYNTATLVPKYLKKNVPVRLFKDFVQPLEADFTLKMTKLFHTWLAAKYMSDADSIYEFGCGTGFHLANLAASYPDKQLFGFDWAQPSVELLTIMRERVGLNIQGRRFDFFAPDESLAFNDNSVVYTFGALEQVGRKYEEYLLFVLKRKPRLCIDVAGFDDLYDTNSLSDYLAWQYHKKRNYLDSYVTRLKALEAEGRIRIVKIHRQEFGNLYDDPHSYIVWKPL